MIKPRKDDGKPKWWIIICWAFTDYGATHIPKDYEGEFYGTLSEAINYGSNLPQLDGWGTLEIRPLEKPANHCAGCKDKTCVGV